MADVKDSKAWVYFHLQNMAGLFTPSMLTRLEKNVFYDFPIFFAQFVLLSKNLTERSECFVERRNEAEDLPVFVPFCLFNSKYHDSFTIYHNPSPCLESPKTVLDDDI